MIDHLIDYIQAQQRIAVLMVGFGAVLLMSSAALHVYGASEFYAGLRNGLLGVGMFSVFGGLGYAFNNNRLRRKAEIAYSENASAWVNAEYQRMLKVVSGNNRIQTIFIAVAALLIAAMWLVTNRFISGILLALVVFVSGNTLIERISKPSINTYFQHLSKSR
ncbi:MAG: hypothetical protein ACFCUH_08610 [Flavobacteriales bacterium]